MSKRPSSSSSSSISSKAQKLEKDDDDDDTSQIHCCFCGFTKEDTKDEGELLFVKVKHKKKLYVHEVCIAFSRRTNHKSTDKIITDSVINKGAICKSCNRPNASIVCCAIGCQKIFHYRCALHEGEFLSNGNFFCLYHNNCEGKQNFIEGSKKTINWPKGFTYMNRNDWSEISEADLKLLESNKGWDPFTDCYTPCVRIQQVEEGHWAWTSDLPYDVQASKKIQADEVICEITGVVKKIDKISANPPHTCKLYLPKKENKNMAQFTEDFTKRLVIDYSAAGNESKFINFRIQDESPNANAYTVTVWSMGRIKSFVKASREILEGESIVLDDSLAYPQQDRASDYTEEDVSASQPPYCRAERFQRLRKNQLSPDSPSPISPSSPTMSSTPTSPPPPPSPLPPPSPPPLHLPSQTLPLAVPPTIPQQTAFKPANATRTTTTTTTTSSSSLPSCSSFSSSSTSPSLTPLHLKISPVSKNSNSKNSGNSNPNPGGNEAQTKNAVEHIHSEIENFKNTWHIEDLSDIKSTLEQLAPVRLKLLKNGLDSLLQICDKKIQSEKKFEDVTKQTTELIRQCFELHELTEEEQKRVLAKIGLSHREDIPQDHDTVQKLEEQRKQVDDAIKMAIQFYRDLLKSMVD